MCVYVPCFFNRNIYALYASVYVSMHVCTCCQQNRPISRCVVFVLANGRYFCVRFVLVRLAVSLVLRSKLDEVVAAFGVCCSSFIPINRGTSSRDILCPEGNEQVVSVRKTNKMMSRTGVVKAGTRVIWVICFPR